VLSEKLLVGRKRPKIDGNNDLKGTLVPDLHIPTTEGVKAGWDVTRPWVDHPVMNMRLVILIAGKDGRLDFMADGYNV